ncbi:hypothetical protein CA3LBN_002432 [Candidozyma haemuli]|uniref:Large ribosomal subunit protein eL14 domain-containing protein n=1 Tax=Candidozyma haemuli TaxID=45357 RepID=A0ABX8I861_9ASCO|nr:hypothetical protein CA3LBN_002432 [[Candida] haemuloni]
MSTTVKTANWRYVESGRIVLIDSSKLATIVEIIDQKRKPNTPPCSPNEDEHNGAISIAKLPFHVKIPRDPVLIDGPAVERQAIPLNKVVLTPLVLERLPRGSRTATVNKKWAAADIDGKWAATSWAKKLAVRQRRANLSDFERFQVMVLRKQKRLAVSKIAAKA